MSWESPEVSRPMILSETSSIVSALPCRAAANASYREVVRVYRSDGVYQDFTLYITATTVYDAQAASSSASVASGASAKFTYTGTVTLTTSSSTNPHSSGFLSARYASEDVANTFITIS